LISGGGRISLRTPAAEYQPAGELLVPEGGQSSSLPPSRKLCSGLAEQIVGQMAR